MRRVWMRWRSAQRSRLTFVPMNVHGVRLTASGPAPAVRIRGVFVERRPAI